VCRSATTGRLSVCLSVCLRLSMSACVCVCVCDKFLSRLCAYSEVPDNYQHQASSVLAKRVYLHRVPDKSSAVAEMGDRLATVDMGRKVGGCSPLCPFWEGASNTMSRGPRPTSVPNGISIHSSVWPQYTNLTRQTHRQRSDSIW